MLMIGTTGFRWSIFLLINFLLFFSCLTPNSFNWTFDSSGATCWPPPPPPDALSVWYDMFPYSCRNGKAHNRNWLKFFRIPNHPACLRKEKEKRREFIQTTQSSKKQHVHLFPPLALKLRMINVNRANSNGDDTAMNGQSKSSSNLSANSTWYTKIGSTVVLLPMAEFMADFFCCCDTSGVRIRMPQKMTLYSTPTRLKQSTIHSGTNTTSQLHETNLSNFNGRNTNCNALTARNSSNSKERSCLTDQTHAPTLATLPNINGIKTSTHKWRPDVRRSHANSSNINRMRCSDNEISMALKWAYESPSNLYNKLSVV